MSPSPQLPLFDKAIVGALVLGQYVEPITAHQH